MPQRVGMLGPLEKDVNVDSKPKLRQVDVPEGKSGDYEIVRFEVDERGAEFHNLRTSMHPGGRFIIEGMYTKLTLRGGLVLTAASFGMSDDPADYYFQNINNPF